MVVRRMTDKDLEAVTDLERTIFPDPWSRDSFEFDLKNNPYSVPLILEDEQKIVGYAIIWKIYEEFHIANLAIQPEKQGKKLGTYLLKEILNMHQDCAYAILEVRESNKRAIQLYKKFGFRTIMKRTRYYRNGETALVMQKIFTKKRVGQ
jgi:ribosomal-protein-alanine N-acetyltransferase